MKRVTNCILKHDHHILMLKKPRRGWYVAPGGKMEPGETIRQSVVREFYEETGLTLVHPVLKGTYTFVIKEGDKTVEEWMMFTFFAEQFEGNLRPFSEEGQLEWVPLDEVFQKPMAEGDLNIFEHVLNEKEDMTYGTFYYTPEYKLLSQYFDPVNV
ncbi:8-oxo-dGTP diphosphatase [Melghiribacillus thermohalophilus]|uniref:8-oxo-dGTP diphosphatase n=1 Tax=Melghiribacillus thermohalophilus TaxID=1324956 RepID=A0A4R3MR31_9BACI|nr:8-oxo-dGTP diphosphatase [Melghiribacillus thermohalophilus]TCT18778.1 8-oxo-dGTP diphosphatase [Melghiribacillus thermohalophilus]